MAVLFTWYLEWESHLFEALAGSIIMIITSFFSYRSGPHITHIRLAYLFHVGVLFECGKICTGEDGRVTFSFRMLRYIESMLRGLPFGALQMFSLVESSSYDLGKSSDLVLVVSTVISCLSFGFWMTNYFKDRMRDKFSFFHLSCFLSQWMWGVGCHKDLLYLATQHSFVTLSLVCVLC